MQLNHEQDKAIEKAVNSKFSWISGGAGCLSGDSVIEIQTTGRNSSRKYSLRDAFLRFNGVKVPEKHFTKWHKNTINIKCDIDVKIGFHKVDKIIYSGVKEVYQIETESGRKIKATADHEFLTPKGYMRLDWLKLRDVVIINSKIKDKTLKKKLKRKIIESLKYHQVAKVHGRKIDKGNFHKVYFYQRVAYARLVVEAFLNKINIDKYIEILKKDEEKARTLYYVPSDIEIHHLDGNSLNDDIYNLQCLTKSEHASLHLTKGKGRNQFNGKILDRIKSFSRVGLEHAYDVAMEDPYRNFIANDFIVHNCGKTTIVKEIAEKLKNPVLVAPTGKAAARLREASGLKASTIHSKLGFIGDGFLGDDLEGQNWIVDESSMIDSRLMYEIIIRKPDSITLTGDSAQLQPVGPGAPFFDIVKSYPQLGQNLEICYRNKESIFQAAMEVRNGIMPAKEYVSEGELWRITQTQNAEHSHGKIVRMVESGELDFEQDIVICCRNGDEKAPPPCTVHSLNRDIAEYLLPREAGRKWRVGDRIICRKNFAAKDVWNGTTGTITALTYDSKGIYVRGDIPFATDGGMKEEILWDGEVLRESQLAYAITAHRSQGSQYRKVVFAVNNNDFIMLSRSLIYTSITRAQKECHVIGSLSSFCHGINTIGDKNTAFKLIQNERSG